MAWFLFGFILGWIPANIAKNKGRDFGRWYTYGILILPVALIHSIFLKPDYEKIGYKKCPFCAEMVKQEARTCRYCGKDIFINA